MLETLLFSVCKNVPGARSIVFHDGIENEIQGRFCAAFGAEFHEVDLELSGDKQQIIGQKISVWMRALEIAQEGVYIFIDVDTLVVRDISRYADGKWDIAITTRDSVPYPINTGVVLLRMNAETRSRIRDFFALWANRARDILADPEQTRRARMRNYPYGAIDQMALYELLGYKRGHDSYVVETRSGSVSVNAIDCRFLNEIESVPVTEDTHIIHYKGTWQPVLIDGYNFLHKERTLDKSLKMYEIYISYYEEAIRHAGKVTWGRIKVPYYMSGKLKGSESLFWLHYVSAGLKRFADRARRKIKI